MAKATTDGTCLLCQGTFSGAGMSRHLEACRKKHPPEEADPSRRARVFHLRIEGQYRPDYWLHVEVEAKSTLADIDQFLRDLWLECCGHVSAFRIDDQSYVSHLMDDFREKDMRVSLDKVFAPKTLFTYLYDFGSSTRLAGRVVSEGDGAGRLEPVRLLARNHPPEIPCGVCGKPAELLCPFCSYEPKGWMCKACARKHTCPDVEPELYLPVVNSPRVGVCAYTGQDMFEELWEEE
jgi:hypothetical protein